MKTIYKLTVAALMAASFSACGNGSSSDAPAATATPGATATPTATPTPTATATPVVGSADVLPSFN